ncbi:MAG: HDOD domain-containing protein [Syntrophorhabdaceae bacterium]
MSVFTLFLVVGSIILAAFYGVIRLRQSRHSRRNQNSAPGILQGPERFEWMAKDDGLRKEKETVLESYPGLRAIPYMSLDQDLYPLSAITVTDTIKVNLFSTVSRLPFATPSLTLFNLLQNPESNAREVALAVSTNPAFSAKVLQTVNSAYFNQLEKVTSIGRAITLLGYNNVRTLALEDMVGNSVSSLRQIDREKYLKIWIHSAVVSVASGYIGKSLFQLSEYSMATIGLLHDIGKFFLTYLPANGDMPAGLPAILAEDRRYGLNHAIIGSRIAHHWQLPHIISDTIEHHHDPCFFPPQDIPDKIRKTCMAVCLADLICNIIGDAGQENALVPLRPDYYDELNLSCDIPDMMTPALLAEIEKARVTVESYMGET